MEKIRHLKHFGRFSPLRKSILTLVLALCALLPAAAQNKTISLDMEGQGHSTREFIEQVEKLSGYTFAYNNNEIDLAQPVSVKASNEEVLALVNRVLARQHLSATLAGKRIVVKPLPGSKESANPTKTLAPGHVSGVVRDAAGQPVIGASVIVVGTNRGVVTGIDGDFSIEAQEGQKLQISFLGYDRQEVLLGAQTSLDIVLQSDNQLIDDVVVVGYGVQKKVNLTGSVAAISSEDIASRPMATFSSGLQGLLPGVTVVNSTAQPGNSSTTIRVRGIGTIGNSNPLILVDGVEGDISAINPDDIESVSVLKDAASAAIYGARAANGVILVTTRKLAGNTEPQITFDAYVGLQTPTRLPEMCNAIEYMTLDNEARENIGVSGAWSQEQFDAVKNGTMPNLYADTDWIDQVLKGSALQQSYGASVVGAFGESGYRLSYRYFDQDGLTVGNTTGEQRHNIRYKMDTKIAKIVTLSSNIGYTLRKITSPLNSLSSGGGAIYNAMRIAPNVPVRYTDGSWAYGGGNTNPVAILYDGGRTSTDVEEVSLLETLKVNLMKGWNVSATYNFSSYNALQETLKKTITFVNPDSGATVTYNSPNSLSNKDYKRTQQTLILQTDFDFHINRHQISGVVGMEQEVYVEKDFEASRNNLTTEKDPTLNLGDASTMSNDALATQWALRSGFGRLSYNFDERYLLEMNLRYDLSSRFHKNNRGGWFPSFSAAWRLSEESFMEATRKVVDNIKIRASYGMLGNQYVGSSNYPYLGVLESYSTGISLIGGNATTGYIQSILANPSLTWEKIKMLDFGIDVALFSNRLSMTFDWYDKNTDRTLLKRTYPAQIGSDWPEENLGSVNNRGWELDVNWQDRIGEFSYGVGFNLADVKNKITSLGDTVADLSGYQIRREGDPIDAFYGYVATGLMTPEDFDVYDQSTGRYALPNIPTVLGYDYQPGDIKYKDISGPDGVPDGRISPEYDRVVVGSNIPRYTYSFRGNLAWKGIDFSFLLQGVGKCDGYLTGSARHAFQDQAGYPQKVHLDRYNIKTNPNPNASYPRLTYNTSFNQSTFSTFWLEDASYLRLKNIQVGYTLPKKWTSKAHISNCRFYVSIDNLFTRSNFFYAYDPETPVSSGGYYPQVKTFVFGMNLSFK